MQKGLSQLNYSYWFEVVLEKMPDWAHLTLGQAKAPEPKDWDHRALSEALEPRSWEWVRQRLWKGLVTTGPPNAMRLCARLWGVFGLQCQHIHKLLRDAAGNNQSVRFIDTYETNQNLRVHSCNCPWPISSCDSWNRCRRFLTILSNIVNLETLRAKNLASNERATDEPQMTSEKLRNDLNMNFGHWTNELRTSSKWVLAVKPMSPKRAQNELWTSTQPALLNEPRMSSKLDIEPTSSKRAHLWLIGLTAKDHCEFILSSSVRCPKLILGSFWAHLGWPPSSF